MKVSSPIGDLPFEPARLKMKKGVLTVEGSMGAWPATVQIYPSDLPVILWVARFPLIVAAVIAAVVVAIVLL
jgi:hypothetical protein